MSFETKKQWKPIRKPVEKDFMYFIELHNVSAILFKLRNIIWSLPSKFLTWNYNSFITYHSFLKTSNGVTDIFTV